MIFSSHDHVEQNESEISQEAIDSLNDVYTNKKYTKAGIANPYVSLTKIRDAIDQYMSDDDFNKFFLGKDELLSRASYRVIGTVTSDRTWDEQQIEVSDVLIDDFVDRHKRDPKKNEIVNLVNEYAESVFNKSEI